MGTRRDIAVDENEALTGAIAALIEESIGRGEFPSASWRVVHEGVTVSSGAAGDSVVVPRKIAATRETIYDLASLTKPLVTTTLVLLAAAEGRIELDDPVADVVEEVAACSHLADTSWTDLLSHRAGFEAWYPFYVDGRDRSSYLTTLLARPLAYSPRSSVIYSDLSFILLFLALERLWGRDFESLAREKIFDRLGGGNCMFRPDESLREQIAATETGNEKEREMVATRGLTFDDWRDAVIWGEANDGNSWYLGGVAGNAGLFGDARSVALLASVYLGEGDVLPDKLIANAVTCHAEGNGERRGLGWQLRSREPHPASPLSESTFGHTGFTGTSVWLDPEESLVVVLLTNRIHPMVRDSGMREIRRRLNELVAASYL